MNLPGRLRHATLGDLLGKLHREGASGVLELEEAGGASAGRRHRVLLSDGLVDGVFTELRHARLGEVLQEHGLIDRPAFAALMRRLANESHRRAGEILVGERITTPAVVNAALRLQLRARLDTLFGLRDALVRFHVRGLDEPGRSGLVLSPREFLHGRPRAREDGGEASLRDAALADERRLSAYRTLGLEPGADPVTVRRAFRKLAREHHPDRHPRAGAGEVAALVRRLSQITAAYHRLGA